MISIALAIKTAAVVAGAAGVGITAAAAASSPPGHATSQASLAATSHARVITIQHGDTLGGLAHRYCGTASAYPSLALANHLANPNHIIAGKQIAIVCTGAPRARLHPKPAATVTVTAPAAPAPTVTVTVTAPAKTKTARPVPSQTPSQTPQQAIVPASTPRPTHKATHRPTPAPTQLAPQARCVVAAPGQPVIPGTYIAMYSRCGLEQLWIAEGGSKAQAARAACMALAISGGSTFKTGAHGNMGLWQIPLKPSGYATYQPNANARAAVILSHNGTNWSWISGTNC